MIGMIKQRYCRSIVPAYGSTYYSHSTTPISSRTLNDSLCPSRLPMGFVQRVDEINYCHSAADGAEMPSCTSESQMNGAG